LGAARAAGFFFGAARRAAGFLAGTFFLSGLDFLRMAGLLAGAFLRLTLAFGLFFVAAMASSIGFSGRISVILVARAQTINPGPMGAGRRRERGYHGRRRLETCPMHERTPRRTVSCLVLSVALIAGGGASAGDIQVLDAWSRPTPPGIDVGVAYFVIDNRGKNDRLVGASSPVARRAELHLSRMEDGVMRMKPLDAVEVKSGVPTPFEPGGRHVMLTGLKHPLRAGDAFPLVLNFANGGPVKVQVRVRQTGGTGKESDEMDHSKMKRSHPG
jgi:copper(I)-binding protein